MGALSPSSLERVHERKSGCSGGKITAGLDSFGVILCQLGVVFLPTLHV